MKSFKVIAVAVVLTVLSAVLIGVYVHHEKILAEEEGRIFKAVYTHPDIVGMVGAVKDAAFAYGRQDSHSYTVDRLWTRKTVGDAVEGMARLNIRADKAWGQVAISYEYHPATGDFRVTRVKLDQLEAAPASQN